MSKLQENTVALQEVLEILKTKANGYNLGYADGIAEAYAEVEPINAELEHTLYGTDTGGKSFYDEFWDAFQNFGNRTRYRYAFEETGSEYIRPKYKIVPKITYSIHSMFHNCPNLKKVEAEYFDFSQLPFGTNDSHGCTYTFAFCPNLEEIEDIGLPPLYCYLSSFEGCKKLHTIAKIRVNENTKFTNAFYGCAALQNLIIEGTIGQNNLNFQWSTKLSKASISSIINALSATTSGLSITLSKAAKETAFSDAEWSALISTKSNWTINLI